MSDILWSDVSEWQVPVDDTYPYPVLAVRSNDGTYRDHHFVQNYQWAQKALDSGKLRVLIIYLVYRQNWQDDLATLKSEVGVLHPNTVVMLDVESWGGQIIGDQSTGINSLYQGVADWIGDPRRVIGYGNVFDLDSLWPTKPSGLRLIIAAYGSNPVYPNKLGHQFTDGAVGGPLYVPPFGYADVNSADGYTLDTFCAALGLADQPPDTAALRESMIIPMTIPPGSGTLPIIVPLGKASAITQTAWVNVCSKGPDGGTVHYWFQDDTGGISDSSYVITFADGHSTRAWKQAPDGTTMIRVDYQLLSGGTLTLEVVSK